MNKLFVLTFDKKDSAKAALMKLHDSEKAGLITIVDSCVAEKNQAGELELDQKYNPISMGASQGFTLGAVWGTVIGFFVGQPLGGFAIGSLTGGLTGASHGYFADIGINDEFIYDVGASLDKASSALFLMTDYIVEEKVFSHLKGLMPVLHSTNLKYGDDESIISALGKFTSKGTQTTRNIETLKKEVRQG